MTTKIARLSEELQTLLEKHNLRWTGKLTAQDGVFVNIIHCEDNVIRITLATANKDQ
jgi:hypothetical protein